MAEELTTKIMPEALKKPGFAMSEPSHFANILVPQCLFARDSHQKLLCDSPRNAMPNLRDQSQAKSHGKW